jgi:apolipoprotein N-acyltransferase
MIRSANTGVSAHINKYGIIKQKIDYRKRGAFLCKVKPETKMTFYVRHGNLIGKTASVLAVILLLSAFVKLLTKRLNSSDSKSITA